MIDLALLAGRLLLLALLYLFLFAAIRAGLGLVSGGRTRASSIYSLAVTRGPSELKGVSLPVASAIVIGRSPGADIVIGDEFVSARHAKVSPVGEDAVLEDLGSTNGTLLNGKPVTRPKTLKPGDLIEIGPVHLSVKRS